MADNIACYIVMYRRKEGNKEITDQEFVYPNLAKSPKQASRHVEATATGFVGIISCEPVTEEEFKLYAQA